MKILAFAASNNLNSINKKLVTFACDLLKDQHNSDLETEILDLNDYEMTIYRPDREQENGVPEQAQNFYKKISDADALIISFAEYNGSYTAAYKNIFDWTSRINQKIYQNKPTLLMATSPGKRGGMGVLKAAIEAAPHFGMNIKGTFSLPQFSKKFDLSANQIVDLDLKKQLTSAIVELTKMG